MRRFRTVSALVFSSLFVRGVLSAAPSAPAISGSGILLPAGGGPITIGQNALPATDAAIADAGAPMTIQAQNAQANVADGGITGPGGNLYVGSGNGGLLLDGGSSAPGTLGLDYGDATVVVIQSPTSIDPASDTLDNVGSPDARWGTITASTNVGLLFDAGSAIYPGSVSIQWAWMPSLSTVIPCIMYDTGNAVGPVFNGEINVCDYNRGIRFMDGAGDTYFEVAPVSFAWGYGQTTFSSSAYIFNPSLDFATPGQDIEFYQAAAAAAGSGAGTKGSNFYLYMAQPGQATTANAAAAGTGGGTYLYAAVGGANAGTGTASNGGLGGGFGTWAGGGGHAGTGGHGGNAGNWIAWGQPGGVGDAGGNGSTMLTVAGGGGPGDAGGAAGSIDEVTLLPFAGKTSTGAVGAFNIILGATSVSDAGVVTGGSSVLAWGATPGMGHSAVTLATSGTTTLSAAQLPFMILDVAPVTTVGNTVLDFGNVAGVWMLNVSGITLGTTFSFSLKSGTATAPTSCPAITVVPTNSMLWLVETTGANAIICNQ